MKTIILTSVFSLLLIFFAGFYNETGNYNFNSSINDSLLSDSIPAYDTVKIGDIVANPQQYEGKVCIINGKYGGWADPSINCDTKNISMISRSDYIIYDETGCIYVNGALKYLYKEKDLKPTDKECIGAKLIVLAYVYLNEGKPILRGN